MKTRRNKPLPTEQSLILIRVVLAKAMDETESWRDDHLGVDLAYLCHAIASLEKGAHVDWSPDISGGLGSVSCTLTLFRRWFPRRHLVWRFIRT